MSAIGIRLPFIVDSSISSDLDGRTHAAPAGLKHREGA
jgi:hypothetical protein